MKNSKKFAFLGDKFRTYILLASLYVVLLVTEKYFNYRFLIVQKDVQSGAVAENWSTYLLLQLIISLVSVIGLMYSAFIQLWTGKTTKFNLFEYYEYIIQTRKEQVFLNFQLAWSKIWLFQAGISTIIGLSYTVIVMDIVEMSLPQYIGAGLILFLGILFGIVRGKLQQDTEKMQSGISVRQNTLTDFLMPSTMILRDRLTAISGRYNKRIITFMFKKLFEYLPIIIKSVIFLMLMYGLVESMVETDVYSYSYIVFTAYGFILDVSVSVGNLIEQISKIIAYKKDDDIRELNSFTKREFDTVIRESSNLDLDSNGLTINAIFTANVEQSIEVRFYKLHSSLQAPSGLITGLDAQNGVGKSRFLQLIRAILPENCLLYDKQTWMFLPSYSENFISKSHDLDFDLIRMLAEGLNLTRIPKTLKEFKEYELKLNANGADGQLMILLQILYFAIKEHELSPDKKQLIILDEAFANISPENSENVIKFISKIIEELNCPCILVSHAHKDIISKYVSTMWKMSNNTCCQKYIDVLQV